ncbi:MAG: CbtB domain-containing protein [Pseudomonadales bacterium]
MQQTTTAPNGMQTLTLSTSTLLQLSAATAFGLGLLLLVGFAPMEALHNASHDARHAFAFPCH